MERTDEARNAPHLQGKRASHGDARRWAHRLPDGRDGAKGRATRYHPNVISMSCACDLRRTFLTLMRVSSGVYLEVSGTMSDKRGVYVEVRKETLQSVDMELGSSNPCVALSHLQVLPSSFQCPL